MEAGSERQGRGAQLNAARCEDAAWRTERRARALRGSEVFDRVYTFATDMLARMGLLLALAFLVGLFCLEIGVAGRNDGIRGFACWMVGVSISGIALLIVLGGCAWLVREGCAALFRKWAEHQLIDLEPAPEGEE